MRTVDEALSEFELIAGAGSEDSKQACAMTLLAWINGSEWSDRPDCTHLLIASAVVAANDAQGVSVEQRAELVRLGFDGALDTWWIADLVVAWALRVEDKTPAAYDRAVLLLKRIAEWKVDKQRPNLTGANLTGANLTYATLTDANLADATLTGANLAGANLTYATLTGANLTGANLTDATLTYATLTYAKGRPRSGMPDGWKLDDNGLWVRS